MFTASFYFLGLALFVLAASICLSWGKRAGEVVEVDLEALHAASVCLPTGGRIASDGITAAMYKELTWDEKARWSDMKAMWTRWYNRCREKAIMKRKAMYSWTRTLALCAVLCLIGVLLEAEFDQPICLRTILTGFRRPEPVASVIQTTPAPVQGEMSASVRLSSK